MDFSGLGVPQITFRGGSWSLFDSPQLPQPGIFLILSLHLHEKKLKCLVDWSCAGFQNFFILLFLFYLFEFIYVLSSLLNDLARFHNQNAMPVFHLRILWQRVFRRTSQFLPLFWQKSEI